MRVVQCTGGAGLAPKARPPYGVLLTLPRQKFQGDTPAEALLSRLVHHPHAPAAEQFEDLVAGDLGRGLRPRVGWPERRVPAIDRQLSNLFRQFDAVMRKAL